MTLPSLSFGRKVCSAKWKVTPQDQFIKGVKSGPNASPPHPLWIETQRSGERIVKLIGYDAGPADIRRSANLKTSDESFDFLYPLQLLQWTRAHCINAIVHTLGTSYVPLKSACFFCPASKIPELWWLAGHEPDLFERALLIERNALTGRHSRFKEIDFNDSWENLVKSEGGFPSTTTCIGLGRKLSWNRWAFKNQVVDSRFKVRRDKLAHFMAMAASTLANDNSLDQRSCLY